jgi:L-ascorbate metabolism protein UlaG (beta-lactamase superfamily)
MSDRWYLQHSVHIEPLIEGWYAWSHLVAPASSACLFANACLPILESYIDDPEAHAAALQDPAFAGGPFVDIPPDRAPEVSALYERIHDRRAPALTIARALRDLDALIGGLHDGRNLTDAYHQVPPALRGSVELMYDLRHQLSFRLFERVLYDRASTTASESVQFLAPGGRRPFVLSTPRLRPDARSGIRLDTPFADPRLDDLFAALTEPRRRRDLLELFDGPEGDCLITEAPPPPRRAERSSATSIHYFGHACLLIETPRVSILVDPSFASGDEAAGQLTLTDLPPRIDYVLITHGHQDHFVLEGLLPIRHRVDTVVVPASSGGALQDPDLRLALEHCGFSHVIEVTEFERLAVPGGSITAIPLLGEHGDLAIRAKTTYAIELDATRVLVAADSAVLDPALFEILHSHCGSFDALFLGMECVGAPLSWGYGALYSQRLDRGIDNDRRTAGANADQAATLARVLGCRHVYVYAMGFEPWVWHLLAPNLAPDSPQRREAHRFVASCRETGIYADVLEDTGPVPLREARRSTATRPLAVMTASAGTSYRGGGT